MKTSYFAKFNKLSEEEKEKYYPIAISTTIPKWYSDYEEHHTFISPINILPKYDIANLVLHKNVIAIFAFLRGYFSFIFRYAG